MDTFMQLKKIEHEKRIEALDESLKIISRDRDNDLRIKSQHAADNLKERFDRMEHSIKKYSFDFQVSTPATTNYKSIFQPLKEKVIERCKESKQFIRTFIDEMNNIELFRMQQFREQLVTANNDLNLIAFQQPCEVSVCLEKHINSTNQRALAKQNDFNNLLRELISIVTAKELKWQDEVSTLESLFETECNKEKLREPQKSDVFDSQTEPHDFSMRIMEVASTIEGLIHVLIIQLDKLQLKDYGPLYQVQTCIASGIPPSFNYNDVFNAISESLSSNPKWTIEEWEQYINDYVSQVNRYYKEVIDGLHLWDEHFNRIATIEEICMNQLSRMVKQKKDADALISELNRCIDRTRTSPRTDVLNAAMRKCAEVIDKMKELIETDHERNLSVLNECRQHLVDENEILQLEFKHFSDRSEINTVTSDKLKPRLISDLNELLNDLRNAISGRRRFLRKNANSIRDDLAVCSATSLQASEAFIDAHYQMQSGAIDDVWMRIFQRIYCVRLAEIIRHRVQINAHVSYINEIVRNDQNEIDSSAQKFANLKEVLYRKMKDSKISKLQMERCKTQSTSDLQSLYKREAFKLSQKCKTLRSSTQAYLEHLRLFVDGGNYTSEEINFIRKALETVLTDVDKYEVTQKQNLDALLQRTTKEINLMLEPMFGMLADEDLENNICECIRRACNELSELTETLLRRNQNLNIGIQRVISKSKSTKCVDEFLIDCEGLQDMFNEVLLFILSQETNDSNFTNNMRHLVDFTSDLDSFKTVLDEHEDEGFIEKVNGILYRAVGQIREMMKANYRAHEGQAQAAISDVMTNYIAKVLLYQLQCNEILLQVMTNYILQLNKLVHCIANYYRLFMTQYLQEISKRIQNEYKLFESEVRADKSSFLHQYRQFNEKLMPLHGHPKNRKLLEGLMLELQALDEKMSAQNLNSKDMFKQYEVQLNDCINHFEGQLAIMADRLNGHYQYFNSKFYDDSHAKLGQQFDALIKIFERIKSKHSNEQEEYDKNLNMKLALLLRKKKALKINSPVFAKAFKSKWQEAVAIFGQYQNSSSSHDLSEIFDVHTMFQDLQTTYLAKMEKCHCDNVDQVQETCKELIVISKNNIDAIVALYPSKIDVD